MKDIVIPYITMVQTPSQSALLPASQAIDRAPAVLRRAGKNALFAADEFFAARISNPHTRRAYARIVGRFLAWCEEQGIELRQVTPGLAGRFIEEIPGSDPTRNLALAALRHFFDALVTRHAVALNPFSSVRGRKHAVVDGKTPQLAIQQARDLLASIDLSGVVGLRDRAVLGVLTYTGARVGALARLRRGDLEDQGAQRVLRFREKGGQQREIPVRHDLDRWLEEYLQAARIAADPKETPLFLAALGKQKKLSRNPLSANSMRRMLKRADVYPVRKEHSGPRFRRCLMSPFMPQQGGQPSPPTLAPAIGGPAAGNPTAQQLGRHPATDGGEVDPQQVDQCLEKAFQTIYGGDTEDGQLSGPVAGMLRKSANDPTQALATTAAQIAAKVVTSAMDANVSLDPAAAMLGMFEIVG